MSYISLYRKWRSQTFDEIIGQPAVVQTLKNALKSNRLAHAYLFSGPRGTGKTSAARILAKALNCEQGPTDSPCGKCAQCEKIRTGQSVNVIEIDAASNRGIDEIRDLREKVRYAPVEGRYKVYIIDEVHMLTPEAFNALLKTLEEPPAQTIFVLATTEPQKVPLTIISRCQRLDFCRIKLKEIEGHLKEVGDGEGFEIEEKALNLIGRSAEGCMRDALSLLDQLVSFAGHKITYDNVVLLLGAADEGLLFALADAIAAADTPQVLGLVKKAVEEGRSVLQVTRDLAAHFRYLLHQKVGSGEILELTDDYLERLKTQAASFSLPRIKEILLAFSKAELDLKWHPFGRLVLEVALLEILGDSEKVEVGGLVMSNSGKVEVGELVKSNSKKVESTEIKTQPQPKLAPQPINTQPSDSLAAIKARWPAILENVKQKSLFGYVSLHEGEPLEINDKGKLVVAFKRGYAFHKERLEELKNKQAVEEAVRETVGERVPLECVIVDGAKSAAISPRAVADFFEGKVL